MPHLRMILSLMMLAFTITAGCQTYTSGLQQSLARADEAAVLTTLRNVALAERAYTITNAGEYGTLQQLSDGGFLDARYASNAAVQDYTLTLNVTPKGTTDGSYTCNADPKRTGERAGRHFYMDSSSTDIHVNETQPATAADKTLQ